ncbi:hypothetical protein, conserved [Trypanosoma brucei gambiense DAL972]|uniref:Threonylcarbamoyl-AMP synthase n=2 Tax=Trypanosoma brucei TaxID=5691 RepID=D0A873_TRYB9|nr:hypothetical protein, conserved [Trypanosoma brucei gambiense DAL972]RHW68268.1 tRNA threonylcarbamoyl adenosine modification protein [Trypanosoma brucei equiperdum]CBH17874.1 hypothetical protein, conserved [Trypanosoma brucei gambiense DAL972]|eukprot:XP_011780138.1 hypothetical protein, conserved [Trypanosoma brucei gambiense DAL972]
MARIIDVSELDYAAHSLTRGGLVALPTETVYGLGGNALDERAVQQIFEVKGRPSTDPLICHVPDIQRAVGLWDSNADPAALEVAKWIGDAIWPGPLTIVFRANSVLPPSVTGNSGYVGVRIPNHPIALQLLQLVNFPVAAPSANTFGHVSPTTAEHVLRDLGERCPSLLVIDGGHSNIGIESTVLKVASATKVEILRRGKVSLADLQQVIWKKFECHITVRDTRSCPGTVDMAMDGPGQLLTHYSPSVLSGMLTPKSTNCEVHQNELDKAVVELPSTPPLTGGVPLNQTVIIDFGGLLQRFQRVCLAYRDLSAEGEVQQACFAVFEALRWSETVSGAGVVLFPLISEWPCKTGDEELLAAVEDRLFRAASGKIANIRFG